jgi:hypothetical protein
VDTRETPADYAVAERRVFGLPPSGLVAVLAACALGAGAALLALGSVLAGALALVAAAVLAGLWWDVARRLRASWLDRAALRTADRSRDGSRFAVDAGRALARATARVAALRLESRRLRHRRRALLLQLGEAVHRGDDADVARARDALRDLERRLEACAAEELDVREAARRDLREERLAVGATEPRPVVEVGDPGFEPGTSALSERRSNQLS